MAIVTISPAILSQNPTEYKQIIKDYYGFTKRAHIDVSDGTLTQIVLLPNRQFGGHVVGRSTFI